MSIELKIPNVGESIQEVQIGQWLKQEGDRVEHDESDRRAGDRQGVDGSSPPRSTA